MDTLENTLVSRLKEIYLTKEDFTTAELQEAYAELKHEAENPDEEIENGFFSTLGTGGRRLYERNLKDCVLVGKLAEELAKEGISVSDLTQEEHAAMLHELKDKDNPEIHILDGYFGGWGMMGIHLRRDYAETYHKDEKLTPEEIQRMMEKGKQS